MQANGPTRACKLYARAKVFLIKVINSSSEKSENDSSLLTISEAMAAHKEATQVQVFDITSVLVPVHPLTVLHGSLGTSTWAHSLLTTSASIPLHLASAGARISLSTCMAARGPLKEAVRAQAVAK